MAYEGLGLHGGQMGWNSGQSQLDQYSSQAQMNIGGQDLQSYYDMVRRQQEAQIQAQMRAVQPHPVQATKSNPDDRLIVLLTEV